MGWRSSACSAWWEQHFCLSHRFVSLEYASHVATDVLEILGWLCSSGDAQKVAEISTKKQDTYSDGYPVFLCLFDFGWSFFLWLRWNMELDAPERFGILHIQPL